MSDNLNNQNGASLKKYIIGFVFSIALTLAAYIMATTQSLPHYSLILLVAGLAMLQCFVQLHFFLHLNEKTKPRWKLLVFISMAGVVSILVVGSLWIMSNLNYRMTPQQMNTYMKNQDGL